MCAWTIKTQDRLIVLAFIKVLDCDSYDIKIVSYRRLQFKVIVHRERMTDA